MDSVADRLNWKPNPGPQTKYFECPAFEMLYGGAAGGGKSESLLMDATRQVDKRRYRAVIFRRTFPELQTSLIDRAYKYFSNGIARPTDGGRVWVFPSGATLRFAHLEHDKDVHKYQSAEFDFVGFDELTSFTEFQYTYMISRVRGVDPTIKRKIRAGSNPGNVGHGWVKERFVDEKIPFNIYHTPEGLSRAFIPAKVYDNPILMQNDPEYIKRLMSLPEKERKALLEGDWDVFEGQFFNEWRKDIHVIKPFKIPFTWQRYRCLDWGSFAPMAIYWIALAPSGRGYVYREIYETGHRAETAAQKMLDRSKYMNDDAREVNERIEYTVCDPSIWTKDGSTGISIAETMINVNPDLVYLIKGNNDRLNGWNALHSWFKTDNKGIPYLRFFNTCVHAVRTIPSLVHDETHVEDVNTKGEDHAGDAIRYWAMSRPRPEEVEKEIKVPVTPDEKIWAKFGKGGFQKEEYIDETVGDLY